MNVFLLQKLLKTNAFPSESYDEVLFLEGYRSEIMFSDEAGANTPLLSDVSEIIDEAGRLLLSEDGSTLLITE